MSPLLPGRSGTTPEPTRNALNTSQGTNEDDSQNDLHPEAGLFHGQMTQNSGPEDGHDMVTGATEKFRNGHYMVTGATEQIGNSHSMTGVHEEVTYCLPSTSSRKKKKTVLPVNHNSAVKTHLRRSKQTKFCRPFGSWQIITFLRTFIITSTDFPNCQSH